MDVGHALRCQMERGLVVGGGIGGRRHGLGVGPSIRMTDAMNAGTGDIMRGIAADIEEGVAGIVC